MLNFNEGDGKYTGKLGAYLNTSHVKLQRLDKDGNVTQMIDLNTSHVKLQLNCIHFVTLSISKFKYISC